MNRKSPTQLNQLSLFKLCLVCKQEKPADHNHFPKNCATSDGWSSWCAQCSRDVANQRYKNPTIREKIIKQASMWRIQNPHTVKKNKKIYMKYNPAARITRYLQKALQKKHLHSKIGMPPKELKKYLESLFQPGMTWENYGTFWEVHKIKKISEFDLTNPEEVKKINHYTNLQVVPIS